MKNKKQIREIQLALRHSNYIDCIYVKEAHQNAYRAFDVAKKAIAEMTIKDILLVHSKLFFNINNRIRGRFRNCDIYVRDIKRKFISEEFLKEQLNSLFEKINHDIYEYHDSDESHKNMLCINRHIEFEDIYPFEDGNGRIGRILYYAMRLALDLPINPILEINKKSYYEWFKKNRGTYDCDF